MNADGSQQVRLTDDPQGNQSPAFSSDGTKIAFQSNRGYHTEIYLMNADGSEQTRLTHDAGGPIGNITPTFSPDGKQIAYASNRDGNWEIYRINLDGSGRKRLTDNPADESSPAYSRDGKRMLFVSNRDSKPGEYHSEIYVMDTDGTNVKHLHIGQNASFGANNQVIFDLATGDGHAIYTMDIDGTHVRRLSPPNSVEGDAKFSPDNRYIVFNIGQGIQQWHKNSNIYVMESEGTKRQPITQGSRINYAPSWALKAKPMGKEEEELLSTIEMPKLSLEPTTDAVDKRQVEIINETSLTGKLVWTFIDKKSDTISLILKQGRIAAGSISSYKIQGLFPNSIVRAQLSPDGKYALVKVEKPQIGLWNTKLYYVWDLQQNQLKPIQLNLVAANLTINDFISWSPDGKYLLFFSYRPFAPSMRVLTVYEWRAGQQHEVLRDSVGKLQPFFYWITPHSPLYSALPEVRSPDTKNKNFFLTHPNIYSYSIESNQSKVLIQDGQFPTASPNNEWLAFFGSENPKKPFPLNADWQYRPEGVALSVARRDGSERKALNVASGTYPVVVWRADNRHLLTLQPMQDSEPPQTEVQEWDIVTGVHRLVAKLETQDVKSLGISHDGQLLFLDVKTTTFIRNGEEIHLLQTLDLRNGKINTLLRLQSATGFDWHEVSTPKANP